MLFMTLPKTHIQHRPIQDGTAILVRPGCLLAAGQPLSTSTGSGAAEGSSEQGSSEGYRVPVRPSVPRPLSTFRWRLLLQLRDKERMNQHNHHPAPS